MSKLKKYEFVGFGCTGNTCVYGYNNPSNWILASRPNSILMGKVLTQLIEKLNNMHSHNDYTIDYHDIGKFAIWNELYDLTKIYDYEYYHYPNKFDGTRDKNGKWVYNTAAFSNVPIDYDDEENNDNSNNNNYAYNRSLDFKLKYKSIFIITKFINDLIYGDELVDEGNKKYKFDGDYFNLSKASKFSKEKILKITFINF